MIEHTIDEKLSLLHEKLQNMGRVAVAFSGGVDSTFLLKVAIETLPKNDVLAITARSGTYPLREYEEACSFAQSLEVVHESFFSDELSIQGFASNPANRCYFCKHELMKNVIEIAKKHGIEYIVDGGNTDDTGDFRPGRTAAKELGILSPLEDVGLAKNDIRTLSRQMSLPTWDKPSFACLASRFPYGEQITKEKLRMVEQAEEYLLQQGFKQFRVRHHGNLARIEVYPEDRHRFFDTKFMDNVTTTITSFGFLYVTLDLRGYKTGSMNDALSSDQKKVALKGG